MFQEWGVLKNEEIERLKKEDLLEDKVRIRVHYLKDPTGEINTLITAENKIGNKRIVIPLTPNIINAKTESEAYDKVNVFLNLKQFGIGKDDVKKHLKELEPGDMKTFYFTVDKELVEPMIYTIVDFYEKEIVQKEKKEEEKIKPGF
jgi:hypothetical protein